MKFQININLVLIDRKNNNNKDTKLLFLNILQCNYLWKLNFFMFLKLSMIESILIVATMSPSMNIIMPVKNSSSILLRRLVLMTFIAEIARYIVAIKIEE